MIKILFLVAFLCSFSLKLYSQKNDCKSLVSQLQEKKNLNNLCKILDSVVSNSERYEAIQKLMCIKNNISNNVILSEVSYQFAGLLNSCKKEGNCPESLIILNELDYLQNSIKLNPMNARANCMLSMIYYDQDIELSSKHINIALQNNKDENILVNSWGATFNLYHQSNKKVAFELIDNVFIKSAFVDSSIFKNLIHSYVDSHIVEIMIESEKMLKSKEVLLSIENIKVINHFYKSWSDRKNLFLTEKYKSLFDNFYCYVNSNLKESVSDSSAEVSLLMSKIKQLELKIDKKLNLKPKNLEVSDNNYYEDAVNYLNRGVDKSIMDSKAEVTLLLTRLTQIYSFVYYVNLFTETIYCKKTSEINLKKEDLKIIEEFILNENKKINDWNKKITIKLNCPWIDLGMTMTEYMEYYHENSPNRYYVNGSKMIQTGSRGGRYYKTKAGNKVYIK
jgi:hypothetical protein